MTAAPALPAEGSAPRLDRALARGIAWTGAVRWGSQVIIWLCTIVVARLLDPSDYGLVGMAAVYLGLVLLVNDFGLGAAIMQRRDLDEDRIARLGGLSVLIGVASFGVSALVALPLSWFFGEPAVRWIITVSSAGFLVSALQVLPRSLLARDLQFRRLALVDALEALFGVSITLALAVLGFRYWSLVAGPLVARVAGTALLAAWHPHRLAPPRRLRTLAAETAFGGHVVAGRIGWYLYSNADFAVVGRLLGRAALGAYTLAWTVASIPVDRIVGLIGPVALPVFSAVQNNLPELRRYLRSLTEGLALVTFPLAIGLALVADQMVPLVFGEQWRSAIWPMRALALSAVIRSVAPLLSLIAIGMGHTRRNMEITLWACLVLPLCFVVGARWGTTGVAVAWLIGHPFVVFPLFLRQALRLTGMPLGSYLQALWPATSLSLVMAGAVVIVRSAMPAAWSPVVQLGLATLAGAATYTLLLWTGYRDRLTKLLALLRGIKPEAA